MAYIQKTYNTLEYKGYYKLLGRYEETDNGVTFDWTGSSIEFNAFCEGDIYLEIEPLIKGYTVYLVPIIDGKRSYEFEDLVVVNQATGHPTVEEHSHYSQLLTEFMKNEVLK